MRAIGSLLLPAFAILAAPTPASARQKPPASVPADQSDDAALADPAFAASLPPLEDAAPLASDAAVETPLPVDTELAAPLPPLATFTAEPEGAATVVATDADEQAPKLRYRTEIGGLKQVGLEDEFRALSVLIKDGDKAANAAQVSARADEDVKLAERLLRAQGYYDALASATVEPVDAKGVVRVSLVATPGDLYTFGTIALTGIAPEPEAIALRALDLKTGEPIVAARVETGEANIALRLPEQGYPFVEVGQRDILLDDAGHRGDYTLPVSAGPKSRFGGFRTAGDDVFGVDHIAILPRFKSGDLYDSREVDDLRQALVATSLFSTVSVEAVRTGATAADGTETVDLLVRQTKGPWRTLAGSAGYATGEGIKLTGSWTDRNRFPDEGALSFTAVAGTQEQSLGTTFRRSNAGKRDRTFQLGASVARQRFDAFDAETVGITGSISRQSTPIWQKRITYSIGGELIATRESRFETATTARTKSTYFIAAIPLQLGYDRSNSLLDPTRGFRVTGRLSPEAQKQSGGGFDGYARMLAETSGYFPISDSFVLAARARVGSIMGADRDTIAPSRRLYAGGGGSVRGFGFQQLGPKDPQGDPIGGRSLTEFAIEGRYRFGNFGIVPFFDAGRVGVGSTPGISDLRYGAGIGGRYYTNFGPMRVDIATPIARRPGEGRIALYISIGQAF